MKFKVLLAVLVFVSLASRGFAQTVVDPETGGRLHLFRANGADAPQAPNSFTTEAPAAGRNISYHGGPVLTSAKVVMIFWGPSFANPAGTQTPGPVANELNAMVGQFGTTGEYNTITQYSGIQESNLFLDYWIDPVNPPHTAVSDADIQNEVKHYINTRAGGGINTSAVYEVFLPNGFYSTSGGATSCGGPNLRYCAYHGNFSYNTKDVKYGSMPYPSCGGCQWTGWTTAQNFEHFICHETREAVTDPDLNAWYDRQGNEADDKCAWSPSPFIGTGGYGYQYEWSNQDRGCVKTK
jgi:hypothetical protein